MMESCGICFRLRLLDGEWEYIAPELLPEWSDAQEQLLGRLRDDPPDAEATAKYAFLHEGVLRGFLSELGEHAKDAAIYWKYGCWFYEQTTRSQLLIESGWDDSTSEAGAGSIKLRAWGERADDLIEQLLRTLQTLPVGQPTEIKRTRDAKVDINARAGVSSHGTVETGANAMEIPIHPEAREQTEAAAVKFDPKTKERGHRSLVLDAPIGTTFAFDVEIEGFVFHERTDTLLWTGQPQSATFRFDVPKGCKLGQHTGAVRISTDGVPVGRIGFQIEVVLDARDARERPVGNEARHYHACFCSYSSLDRAEMLKRAQGIRATRLRRL
jgi:hypothetical protein